LSLVFQPVEDRRGFFRVLVDSCHMFEWFGNVEDQLDDAAFSTAPPRHPEDQ
jgi:hypothetical protein